MTFPLGPLLWLADVWLEMCRPLHEFPSGPPALTGGRVAGEFFIAECMCLLRSALGSMFLALRVMRTQAVCHGLLVQIVANDMP
jgi:hypothetical protein